MSFRSKWKHSKVLISWFLNTDKLVKKTSRALYFQPASLYLEIRGRTLAPVWTITSKMFDTLYLLDMYIDIFLCCFLLLELLSSLAAKCGSSWCFYTPGNITINCRWLNRDCIDTNNLLMKVHVSHKYIFSQTFTISIIVFRLKFL